MSLDYFSLPCVGFSLQWFPLFESIASRRPGFSSCGTWLGSCGAWALLLQFSSVQFSCSVVSDYLWPHESQHARPPCPSPAPGVHSDSRPLSPWCHPAISSSVIHFSSCPWSLPASESFPMSQLFAWGGQSTGVSASACLSNEHTGLIFWSSEWLDLLAVQGTLMSLLQHHSLKATVLWLSAFFIVQLSQPYMTTGRTISLTLSTFVGKVISLLFNMLLRFFIAFHNIYLHFPYPFVCRWSDSFHTLTIWIILHWT